MKSHLALLVLTLALAGCPRTDPADARQQAAGAAAPAVATIAGDVDAPPSRPARAGFASLPDRGELLAFPARQPVRRGAYAWHAAELSEAHALQAISGVLHARAPSGEPLAYDYLRHVEHPSGDWTWVGRLRGGTEADQAILTFGARAGFGSLARADAPPLKLVTRGGALWIVEADAAALAQEALAAGTRPRPDYRVPPKPDARGGLPEPGFAEPSDVAPRLVGGAVTIDVVLGYTTGFAASLGGASQAVTRLNYLVEVNNQTYINSQVQARMRLVHALQVSYPDATDNEAALNDLTGHTGSAPAPVAPGLQPLRAARDAYGADLVSLVRKYSRLENDGCGIAWLIGGGQSGYATSDSPFGYSVVSDGEESSGGSTYFCRDETLAHEMGHNLGSQHDRATATENGEVSYGVFPWSFGYKTATFNTVMAYGDPGQVRYRVFSNPRTGFCGGRPCGVDGQADNARSLEQTLPTAATFRATVVPSPGAARRDVDGDGRSDLLWHHPNGNLAAWMINGTSVVRDLVQFAGGGFVPIASGDFNGDGRTDVVWNRPQGDMQVWLGNGASFTGRFLRTYPAGWTLAGAADVDGDGRSDLVWHNPASGNLAYWIMDGATVVREAVQYAGGGFQPVALGDFNGDGRADILWNRPQGDLQVWIGNGMSFTGQFLRGYPYGWTLVGAGDVGGDGRADLLWHQAGSGRLAWWTMSGALVTGDGMQGGTGGFVPVALGDFNGDGRVDIVWNRPQADLQVWLGNGTGFAGQFLRIAPAGWSMVAGLR